jgi:hypothetical protein
MSDSPESVFEVADKLRWRLVRIRELLRIACGSALTLLVLAFVPPSVFTGEGYSVRFWVMLVLLTAPMSCGLWLLFSPTWRQLSLLERKDTIWESFAVSWLATFIWALEMIVARTYINYQVFMGPDMPVISSAITAVFGLGLVFLYRWLNRESQTLKSEEMFP